MLIMICALDLNQPPARMWLFVNVIVTVGENAEKTDRASVVC